MLVVTPSLTLATEFKASMASQYKIRDLGEVKKFLGMRIYRDRGKRRMWIDQEEYIRDVCTKYGFDKLPRASIPVPIATKLTCGDDNKMGPLLLDQQVPYREAVGSIMYAMQGTRPDISYAIGLVSRYLAAPCYQHWEVVKMIGRYLWSTSDYALSFDGLAHGIELIGYSDADWAGDTDTRRSTTGYCFTLGGGAITWRSRRQPTVALSSTEAEYMAATEATTEAVWLRGFLYDLGFGPTSATTIYEDNQATIKLSENDVNHARTKHIDVRYHYLRECVLGCSEKLL
jgi:hypothetical protein